MLSLNEATLMGWVGTVNPPQGNGQPLRFTLATSRGWKDRETGDWREETEWHRVTVWKAHARLAERLAKGARVYVEGRLHYSEYQDDSGERRTGAEIIARPARVEVLADGAAAPPDRNWQANPAPEEDNGPGI